MPNPSMDRRVPRVSRGVITWSGDATVISTEPTRERATAAEATPQIPQPARTVAIAQP